MKTNSKYVYVPISREIIPVSKQPQNKAIKGKLSFLLLCLLSLLLAVPSIGWSQALISAHNTFFTTALDGWHSSTPAGYAETGATYVSSTSSTTGGTYDIANSGFGFRPSSSSPNTACTVTMTFKNTTGTPITSLTIQYDAFQITAAASRTPNWTVTSSLGAGVAPLSWTFDATKTPASPAQPTVTLTGLNVANNGTFTISWASDRGAGAGSSPLVGFRNIKIKSISAATTPTITIADNGTQPAAGNIAQSTIKNVLQTFTVTEGGTSAGTLNQVTIPLGGDYVAADIAASGIKLWANTSNVFPSTPLSSQSSTATGTGETITFGPSLNQAFALSGKIWLWVTADVSATAITRSINAKALAPSNFTFTPAAGTSSGTVSAGGAQTFVATPSFSATTLTAFSSTCINSTTGPNSFTITGANLTTANVAVGPCTGFTFSTTSGGTYTPSLSLTQPGGSFSQQVFVNFQPATAPTVFNSSIQVSGGGAPVPISVNASGTSVQILPIAVGSSNNIAYQTATIIGTITNGCTPTTSYGIEYSTVNNFANGSGTQVAGSGITGGTFSVDIAGLTANTIYYYRVNATNDGGTSYSAQGSFVTSPYFIYKFGTANVNSQTTSGAPDLVNSNLNSPAPLNTFLTEVNTWGAGSTSFCGTGYSGFCPNTNVLSYTPSGPAINLDLKPNAGYVLTITNITVGLRSSGSGPLHATLAYSIDGGATWIAKPTPETMSLGAGCGSMTPASWDITSVCGGSGITVGNPDFFKFRIYFYNANASNGNTQIQNLFISGTVSNVCNVTASIAGSATICSGSSDNIIFTGSPNAQVTYTKNGVNQTINLDCSGTRTLNEVLTSQTTYALVSVKLGSCSNTVTGNAVVNVNPLPTVSIAPNTSTTCSGDNVSLQASGSSVSYQWIPSNDLDALTGSTVNADPTTVALTTVTSTYTVIGTDVNSCSAAATATIKVKPLTTTSLAVTPPSAVCTGLISQQLTASGAVSYNWAPGTNINTTAGATVTAQISQLTFYTVTGTGSNGCTTSVVVPVATVATGGTISPAFSIICSGGTKLLTVTGAAGHDYQWQISSDNVTWSNINGATNTTYTTIGTDGNTNKYYRLLAQSNTCWNVASTTAEVDVSHPTVVVTTAGVTDNSVTLNWAPVGSGNYNISYSGSSSGTVLSTTPPKTVTGLTNNGNYTFTLTQTGTGLGSCPATGTATLTTLCSTPAAVTVVGTGNTRIDLSWTGGAGNYRVYYRPLYAYNGYFTKDVVGATSTTLFTQGGSQIYKSVTYEIYVAKMDCPTTGKIGQASAKVYATTTPGLTCEAPVIDSVKSLCPVQIEVWVHGSPTNQYYIDIERITPTVQPVTSYPVTGGYFTLNTSAGQNYLITARSICGGSVSNMALWPGALQIKPQCGTLTNLLLSNPTCNGFTASWNSDECIANNASYYQLFIRQVGTINWNSYGVAIPAFPIGPYKVVSWLGEGKNFDVFAKAIYSCNGYLTYGATTQTLRTGTLSAGCREENMQPQDTKPAIQQTSADNTEVLSIYPNPNNGQFAVDLSRISNNEDAVRIEVMNMIGQTVVTRLTTIDGGHMSEFINLPAGAAPGTYIVRVTAGKNVYTNKINTSK